MSLSAEERRRIYEEEKQRLENEESARQDQPKEDSSLDLKPNVVALLAYLGAWVTGIFFLVVEQKNRFVRFHAAQSIVTFASLGLIHYLLGRIPLVGWTFNVILGVVTFILWIVLMVRAYHGELFKLPVAGVLAERLISLATPKGQPETTHDEAGVAPPEEKPEMAGKTRRLMISRAGRIASSAFAIAWCFALLIFFNYFNQYIAYYHVQNVNGVDMLVRESILNPAFASWLPVLTVALIFTMIGHTIIMVTDRYVLREATLIILDLFAIAVIATLLSTFPFDFSVISDAGVAETTVIITQVVLALVLLGLGIGLLVRFIKLIVNLAAGTRAY